MYTMKEVLELVCVQHSNSSALKFVQALSTEECEARMVGKEAQKKYGLKSPKLSKCLISLGLPAKAVSLALASANISEVARVTAGIEDLLEMGDSVHYKSCQRTGGPMRKVEELSPYMGTCLWLFVVGERMSLNGKGFVARRLLRMMFKDELCTEPAGIYIERAYGDVSLLPNDVLLDFFGLPLLKYESEAEGIPLYCPSALHGYNDTLAKALKQQKYSLVECKKKSLLKAAYTGRHLQSGAYHCSLAENRYNPQNQRFATPALPNPWRGLVSKDERAVIQIWISLFGYPHQRMERTTYFDIISCSSLVEKLKVMVYRQDHRLFASVVNDNDLDTDYFLEVQKSRIVVERDVEQLGFLKAVSILSKWITKEGIVSDQDLELVNLWVDCFGYPREGEMFSVSYQNAHITHMGRKYKVRYCGGTEIAITLTIDGIEKYFFSYYSRRKESRVLLSLPKLGFEPAVSIELAEATSIVSSLLGFCPISVGRDFSFGDSELSIWVSSGIRVRVSKPGQVKGVMLEVQNYKVEVHEDCPELGFWRAVTLEEEFYGNTYYSDRRTVQRDCPELGFWRAVPIICYQVNETLWVTGPLHTK